MSFAKKRTRHSTDTWRFYRDEANRWRWKYILQGRIAAQAYSSFDQYSDCVRDARLHGYREPAK